MVLIGKTLYVTDRRTWRAWLRANHASEPEVWLIYYRKDAHKPRIDYNDAVEEALCYGWIDSIVKKLDDERLVQRFSPRKPTSILSPMNRERLRRLVATRKMTHAGLAAVAHAFDPKKDGKPVPVVVPAYIRKALQETPGAWEHFEKFPESYKRIRIAYIEHQKTHGSDQYMRSLKHFVAKTAQNKRIGLVRD